MNPSNEQTSQADQISEEERTIQGSEDRIQGNTDEPRNDNAAATGVVLHKQGLLNNKPAKPVLTDEEKELQQALIPFKKYPKLKKWTELFLDKSNKATYGNRTESAMQAYDCGNRADAATIGSQNYRKLKGLALNFFEDKGVTVEKLLDVLAARALTSDKAEWWKLAAEVVGIHDPKLPSVVVNNNTQNNITVDVNGQEMESFNESFQRFVESQ